MSLSKDDLLELFSSKITLEEQFILIALYDSEDALNKEALWSKTNEVYKSYEQQEGVTNGKKLLPTRYALDHHTLKLEGANLVDVLIYGRTRIYKLSEFGKEILEYRTKQNKEGD